MNRLQRIKTIIQTLLCPFTLKDFLHEDLLLQLTLDFQKIQNPETSASGLKEYRRIQSKLVEALAINAPPERLSEVRSLLNLFYPDSELNGWLKKNGAMIMKRMTMNRT